MSSKITHRVPAKVILLGEHFVVHGSRAISTAVNLFIQGSIVEKGSGYIHLKYLDHSEKIYYNDDNVIIRFVKYLLENWGIDVTPRIEVEFGFPTSAGLGSSASLGALLVYLIYRWWNKEYPAKRIVYKFGEKFEEMIHGTPSGIDLTTVIEKGIILFKRGEGVLSKIAENVFNDTSLVIVDSGLRRSTGQLVSMVTRYLNELDLDIRRSLISSVDEIVLYGWESLKRNNFDGFFDAMKANHYLLKYIGVYKRKIDEIITDFYDMGGFVAKVTGAGGGGCIIGFVEKAKSRDVLKFFREKGFLAYAPKIYFGD